MFIMPAKGRITSPFGMRNHPISGGRSMHWGIDVGSHADNAILAAGSGRVRFVDRQSRTSYGNYMIITHSNGFETLYAHLASISVNVGNQVRQGQRIGVKGTTGNSTGIHLHFEVHTGRWNNKWSNAKNPLNYISDSGVKQVQTLLSAAGYSVTIDGSNGPATKAAIRAFQKDNGLAVDGSAGPITLAALKKAKPKENLVIDGRLGKATISAAQRYFGTRVDGRLSVPSSLIIAIQKWLGTPQDGRISKPYSSMIAALQKRFGTPVDGKLSDVSSVIMELQRRLNKGKL